MVASDKRRSYKDGGGGKRGGRRPAPVLPQTNTDTPSSTSPYMEASAVAYIGSVAAISDNLSDTQWYGVVAQLTHHTRALAASATYTTQTPIVEQLSTLSSVQRILSNAPLEWELDELFNWCLTGWLRLKGWHPQWVPVLRGLGEHWLLKARPILGRIRAEMPSSSSGSEGGQTQSQTMSSPDYVEARGLLIPARDYLRSASERSVQEGSIEGSLLALTAQANMDLGTVTRGKESQAFFTDAVRYLRAASSVQGYELSEEHERCLEDYEFLLE